MHQCTALTTTDGNDNKTVLSWITFTVGKLSAFCFKKTVFELWAWKASSWVENSHYPDGWREPCLKGCNATVLIEVGIIVFLPGIIVRTRILIHRHLGWGAYCRFYPLHIMQMHVERPPRWVVDQNPAAIMQDWVLSIGLSTAPSHIQTLFPFLNFAAFKMGWLCWKPSQLVGVPAKLIWSRIISF